MSKGKPKEGWTWLTNSPKWHYFRDGRSLCNKFMLFGKHNFKQADNNRPDNCAMCKKKLDKERLTKDNLMITKRTDNKVRAARAKISSALRTNRLLGYQENGLRAILTSLDKWIEAHGRPEKRGK